MSLTKYIPTLFLTQKDERASKVKGLELASTRQLLPPILPSGPAVFWWNVFQTLRPKGSVRGVDFL